MLFFVPEGTPLPGLPTTCTPSAEVTHLVLPVPSFTAGGVYRGKKDLPALLRELPPGITVIGGFLNQPMLRGYRQWDLLTDEAYIAQNAAITAYGALQLLLEHSPQIPAEAHVLLLGWGRIGKCLGLLLHGMGVPVTVAARKEAHRAMISALGLDSVSYEGLDCSPYGIIINTVPALVLPNAPEKALKIELASKPGMAGGGILAAGGLPGKLFPESAGRLISQTILRYVNQDKEE